MFTRDAAVVLQDTTITRSVASGSGGGLFVESDAGTINMTNALFDQCHAEGAEETCWLGWETCSGGGAVFIPGNARRIVGCLVGEWIWEGF